MLSERERCIRKTFSDKRSNAKRAGIEFTLRFEDIVFPDYCPVLNLELLYERGNGIQPGSPSYDRICGSLGYVPGNVIIVSHLANTMKNSGTIDDMRRVYEFYRDLKVQH